MTVTTSQARDPWIVRPRLNPGATFRLFCFPYAGVGASVFRTWPQAFPSHVELVMMQPPGREGRWSETPLTRAVDIAAAAAQAVRPFLGVPYAFYGHSLGALVSFELTRLLRRQGLPGPRHLFASAHRAPQLPNPHPAMRDLPDGEFVDQICTQYGGIPQAVLDNRDLLELMLPCLRADFRAYETYEYVDEAPLACPITTFGGRGDRRVSEFEVRAWQRQTAGEFRTEMFAGDHFFLQDWRDALVASMMRDLRGVRATALGR